MHNAETFARALEETQSHDDQDELERPMMLIIADGHYWKYEEDDLTGTDKHG